MLAASEAGIAAHTQRLWRTRHDRIGTEGAACFAALPQLLQRGLLRAAERVVIVNTGSIDKYLPAVQELLQVP